MQTIRTLVLLLFCATSFLGACKSDEVKIDERGNPPPTQESPPADPLPYVFKAGTESYSCFRIPAIVKSKEGTLLAFAEGRKGNCGDEGDIDLVLRRSTDGGNTWSDVIMVWDDAGNTCGNPAPIVDRESGRIHLLMTWNLGGDRIGTINDGTSKDTRRVFYTYSDDDGKTWSEANEITESVKKVSWGWYATGPGHGLQMSKGAYDGRLVVACDYIEIGPGRKGYSHTIYSDDHGKTWELGGVTPSNQLSPNESTVAELSDGKLMLNMRCGGSGVRMISRSTDGGESWAEIQPDYKLVDPTCQGSILNHEAGGIHALFFSNAASSSSRINMTIRMSTDDGQTWPKRYQVHPGPSAYSDIVMVTDEKIGILFEGGVNKPYEGIAFRTIETKDFK